MSIVTADGPIARAYAKARRWANAAEERRYTHPQLEALRLRLWRKVNALHRVMGREYYPDPMDRWARQSVRGAKGSKFRRRLAAKRQTKE